jgi:FxLD family lantipeptide
MPEPDGRQPIHATSTSALLHADISIRGPSHFRHQSPCPARLLRNRSEKTPSTVRERTFTLTTSLTTEATTMTAPANGTTADDPFALDIQITTDIPADHPLAACGEGTNDGCDPTCASACVSSGI